MGGDRVLFQLLAWLATYALHSTVLIVAAWIASTLITRTASGRAWILAARESLWKLALLGGIVTATLHSFGLGPWTTPVILATPASSPVVLELGPVASPGLVPTPSIAHARTPIRATAAAIPQAWIRFAAIAWASGVALALFAWWADWKRLRRRIRGLAPVRDGATFELLESLRARGRVRTRVRLARAPHLLSPITVGILRPTICLPPRAESDLAPDELEALLAHELAHAVRHDPAWLAIGRAIGALLFVQPLNRIARAHLAEDAEIACDDWAVRRTGNPLPLASCLTEIATWLVGDGVMSLAPAMAARGSRLSRRVRRLLDETRADEEGAAGRPLVATASIALIAIPMFVPGVRAQDDRSVRLDRPARLDLPARAADGSAFAGLEQELDALALDLEALRTALAARPARSDLQARMRGLDAQMQSLRSMSAELQALFELTQDSSPEREGLRR